MPQILPSVAGRAHRWPLLLLIALLGAGLALAPALAARLATPGPALTRVAYQYRPILGFEQIDLTAGWRFRPDPTAQGAAAGWAALDFDDSGWDTIPAGDSWENLGYPGYDGLGWYRHAVTPPATWGGKPVYLWLSGADDEIDVYLDGRRVGHYGDANSQQGLWHQRFAVRVDPYLRLGEPNVVAIAVSDWHGDGGLADQPVVLSTSADAPLSSAGYAQALARRDPAAVWPAWARGGDRAWTVAGSTTGHPPAVVGIDGSAAPSPTAAVLTWWVYDPARGRLSAPESLPVEQRLQDGYQPTPISTWRDGDLVGESTVLASDGSGNQGWRQRLLRFLGLRSRAPGEPTMLVRLRLTNAGETPRQVVAVVALRPYGPDGSARWLGAVEGDGDIVRVDGRLALVADERPAGFGAASLAGDDLSALVRRGAFPAAGRLVDPQGLATIGLEYPLSLAPGQARDLTFKLPMGDGPRVGESARVAKLRELDFDEEERRLRAYWQARLQRVALNLPDRRYSDAFYASLGYLLSNLRGELVTSGPFAHNAMWYRDAAYVAPALLAGGLPEVVPPILATLRAGQLPSGEFPAALDVDRQPRFHERHEWDAQGEYIYTVAQTYRMTRDRRALEEAYPSVASAARFVVELSRSTRTPAHAGTPLYGILPPGDSAEDLGPREWRHYWDDFWAIGGLEAAAGIAGALGRDADAREFAAAAADLRGLTLASIQQVGQAAGIDYVPNGPEDTTSSSMARGTSPAVWPLQLFPPDDPLILRSFARYYDLWVKPNAGAYMHNSGNYWVYGGLELAHSYLLLGQAGLAAEMAQWAIENQTAPGTYAWAEAVKQGSRRFSGGDMPHSWAAAEYVLYLRDALVREEGDRLVLADAVPAPWLQPGLRVEIHRAPTAFGQAGYSLVSRAEEGYWELTIDEGTAAPGGYRLRGPFPSAPTRLIVDGREVAPVGGSSLLLPAGARVVRVYFR